MPVDPDLRPLLDVLGTGGTTEMAARMAAHIAAEIAAAAPPDVAALRGEVKAALAEATRMTRLREEILASVEEALADIGVTLTADDDPVSVMGRTLREQAAEIRRLNTLLEPKRASLRELVEASSLGTPDAVAARASVPAELAQAAVARAAELGDDDLTAVTVSDFVLAREAAASVALDRDPRAETIVLDEAPDDDEGDGIDWDDDAPEPPDDLLTEDDGPPAEDGARPAPSNDEIRDWCRRNKVAVSDRGPIGKTARAAYNAAHQEA